MKYAVFTDIDDTLCVDGKTPAENIEAIKKARENGHLVFINTGRSTGIIYDELRNGLFDGIVSSIGGEVYIGEKTLLRKVFSTDETLHFAKEFLEKKMFFIMEATSDSPLPSIKSTDKDPLELIRTSGCVITKIYVEGSPTKKQVEEIGEKYQLYIHPWYFEFTTKGCTKSTGMNMVLEYFGIEKENCIAIGDSVNDIEMLTASGNPVCVGNAIPALKEMCVYETCHAKDGALYDCFKHFGLI